MCVLFTKKYKANLILGTKIKDSLATKMYKDETRDIRSSMSLANKKTVAELYKSAELVKVRHEICCVFYSVTQN